MSAKHLTIGSEPPAKVPGKLRLYSMRFCPYAQRVRLVLLHKNVPHDVVYINLVEKPEWYFKVHPEGKVPALDVDGKVIVESLDIVNYLDQQFPEHPLYPTDPNAKQADLELLQKMGTLCKVFSDCILKVEDRTLSEWFDDFLPILTTYEDELKVRGTTFFGGEKPGILDFMLWPWAERLGVVKIIYNEDYPMEKERISALRQWKKSMRQLKAVQETYTGPQAFWQCIQMKMKKIPAEYDGITY